jgi:hypothetical protein
MMSLTFHTSQTELGPIPKIEDLLEFLLVRDQEPENERIYRGQREATWWPVPKIDRPDFVKYRELRQWSRKMHEEMILADFMKWARPHIRTAPESKWEWLAIAQHHGLATRLLAQLPMRVGVFEASAGEPPNDFAVRVAENPI